VKEPWKICKRDRMGKRKKGAALNPHPRLVLLDTRSKLLPKGLRTS